MTPAVEPTPSLVSAGDRRRTRLAAQGGRISLVVLSVVGVYAAGRGLDAEAAVVTASLAAAWLGALQFARFACPNALGPGLATAVGTVVGFAALALTPLWLPSVELSPARALAMALSILAFVGIWETVVQHTTSARRQVLIVGSPSAAEAVAKATSHEHAALDVLGVVPDRAEEIVSCDVPVLGRLEGLEDVIAALQPDVIVVADGIECETAVDRLLDVPSSCFRVIGFTSYFEHVLGQVPVSSLRASWFVSLLHVRQRAYSRWSKRAFDISAAFLVLLLATPIMLVIALFLAPSGTVMYRQTRIGERGRRFTIVKFRTMLDEAEADGRARWASSHDPRVTSVGRILRKAHLDELPQLLNVLRGDMSMVGPRPERPEFVELLEREVPFWHRRLLVKPGLTGWAQLKGGYASDCEAMTEKLSYDLWYLRNRNVIVDLAICGATAISILRAFIPFGRPTTVGEAGTEAAP
jgi:exopolysaccharide biosynthesis polyprenyl glycosylphosphotransferase